jgi:crotonobetainyl-CoA:carnitine CoA-transferase CaiB-like acyl-CoA transferase
VCRPELYDQNPGAKYADHARGNLELRRTLGEIFASRTTADWLKFGLEVNTPIRPLNDSQTITRDPHFLDRLPMRSYAEAGTDLMPSPIKLQGEELPVLDKAPVEPGCDTDEVLSSLLGYDAAKLERLRAAGVLG